MFYFRINLMLVGHLLIGETLEMRETSDSDINKSSQKGTTNLAV